MGYTPMLANLPNKSGHQLILALTIALLGSTTSQLASADDLKGCWLRTKVANRTTRDGPVGDLRDVKSTCYRHIEELVFTTGCVGSNLRPMEQYRIPADGQLEAAMIFNTEKWRDSSVRSQLKDNEKLVKFSSRSYRLKDNELTITYPALSQPDRVESIEVLRRIEPPFDRACLPPIVTVSAEDFARYYRIPELVTATAISGTSTALAMAMAKDRLGGIPANAIRPEHVRRLVIEFDKIVDEQTASMQRRLKDDPQSLAAAFLKNYKHDPAADAMLATLEKQTWAGDAARELLGLSRLTGYLTILGSLDRSSFLREADKSSENKVDIGYGLGRNFQLPREMLLHGIYERASDGMLPVSRQEIAQLRELSIRNADTAKARRYDFYLLDKLGNGLGNAVELLMAQDRKANVGAEADPYEQLELLALRFRANLDPKALGYCNLKELDERSAASSAGDWKKARKPDGAPIAQGSPAHFELLRYYSNGCSAPKDFALIRKVMTDVAETPHSKDTPIRPDAKYCRLALWTRHGIGGDRNERLATEYEKQFRAEAYRVGLDPTEEELARLRAQYPASAPDNFLCPRRRGKTLAGQWTGDPRDPWREIRQQGRQ